MTEQQKSDVIRIGFGGLLDIQFSTIPQNMTEWLLTAFDPETKEVKHNGTVLYTLTPGDVHDTFLLPWCPAKPVLLIPSRDYSDLRRDWATEYTYPASPANYTTSISYFEETMKTLERGQPDFARMFVVYAFSVFLDPVSSNRIDFRPLMCACDVANIHTYDWCSYVFDRFCDAATRFNRERMQRTFSGCLTLLVLTYFHRMGGKGVTIPPLSPPLVQHWRTWGLQRRMAEEIARGFGTGVPNNTDYPVSKFIDNSDEASGSGQLRRSRICFNIPPSYHNDEQLETLLPNVSEIHSSCLKFSPFFSLTIILLETFLPTVAELQSSV